VARYVIDAPTLQHLVDSNRRVRTDHQLVAPNAIRSEALELLLHEVNAGRRTESDALQAHEQMTKLKIRLLGDRVSRGTAWKIAREQGWDSLRDAEYVAVARLQADALVTVDRAFAARVKKLVPMAPLKALFTDE
jgi:predicted nucleic acid-binding protein